MRGDLPVCFPFPSIHPPCLRLLLPALRHFLFLRASTHCPAALHQAQMLLARLSLNGSVYDSASAPRVRHKEAGISTRETPWTERQLRAKLGAACSPAPPCCPLPFPLRTAAQRTGEATAARPCG
jgi:hypothetical protein